MKINGKEVKETGGNQGTMYNEVREYFHDSELLKDLDCYSGTEKSHSKLIKCEYYMTNDISWITNHKEWKNLLSIGYEKKQ